MASCVVYAEPMLNLTWIEALAVAFAPFAAAAAFVAAFAIAVGAAVALWPQTKTTLNNGPLGFIGGRGFVGMNLMPGLGDLFTLGFQSSSTPRCWSAGSISVLYNDTATHDFVAA